MRNAKDLGEALLHSKSLEAVLKRANISALNSFHEAKQDLLVIHQLEISAALKRSFSTTNAAESLNSTMMGEDTLRNKRWRDSEHFQRWVATAALKNEKGCVGYEATSGYLSSLVS